jgi:hypothetical protein
MRLSACDAFKRDEYKAIGMRDEHVFSGGHFVIRFILQITYLFNEYHRFL